MNGAPAVRIGLWVVVLASAGSMTLAQRGGQPQEPPVRRQPGDTPVAGQCLPKEDLDLISSLQALTRPTLGVERDGAGDDQPPFNPHYFVGTWKVEGVLPESPLAPAGEVTGSETVRLVESCTYESTLQAKSPGGAFTVKAVMVYDRAAGYAVRSEQDSRGFQVVKMGRVGGDAGGYFTHHWDAPPFAHKGRRIHLRGNTFLASPDNFRLRMQISVDGGPFTNFGTLWWSRQTAAR
jgi:hypothetical protein